MNGRAQGRHGGLPLLYVPDLPGCVAVADTLEETERLMVEGIKLCIEARKEAGQPVPEPMTKAKPVTVAL